MNRRVRAKNVRVGDELEWLDLKKRETVVMVVQSVEERVMTLDGPGIAKPTPVNAVVLRVYKKTAKRRQTYVWRTLPNSLMRVRRPTP